MYAISIEQPHAATILTGPPPFHYRSWRTDHRGMLLIHARKPKSPIEREGLDNNWPPL